MEWQILSRFYENRFFEWLHLLRCVHLMCEDTFQTSMYAAVAASQAAGGPNGLSAMMIVAGVQALVCLALKANDFHRVRENQKQARQKETEAHMDAIPARAVHPLPRLPTEITANPVVVAQEERQQEGQRNEWEERRSLEHGNRVYWVNTNTRESTWKKPRELARDDNGNWM